MLAVVPALAAYYRMPIHPFHRAVLGGFGVYLVIYAGLLAGIGLAAKSGPGYPEAYNRLNAIDPYVYLACLAFWAYAAWRKPTTMATPPWPSPRKPPKGPSSNMRVLQVLQPWATTR
jgi:hypothetical protein